MAVVAEADTTPVMISEAGCAEQDDTPNEVLYHLALEKYSSYVYLWYNVCHLMYICRTQKQY